MKIYASLAGLFISFHSFAVCEFKPEVKKVISLSGTMTVLLKEAGLLKAPQIKGISVFSPVSSQDYSGKIYPGGLFIAQSTLSEFSDSVVFFDQSEQLKKILKSRNDINELQISTRGKLPLEVIDDSIKILSPFVQGCDVNFQKFKALAVDTQKKLLSKMSAVPFVIFYLGSIKGSRLPEMVVLNDGAVALLLKEKKIKSYPSTLSYVNWSSKVMSGMPSETMHVGLEDPGMKTQTEIKRSSNRMTLIYPGVLVPGYSQLKAFLFWADSTF